ncbi:hypothetical protein V5799_025725 [Amblyomma americanum]|uniref:Uncharacterized protein n=1 Tax=Amblyomma americanum TaxID=6943 RepID=A0AAQ4E8N5_AMBAM
MICADLMLSNHFLYKVAARELSLSCHLPQINFKSDNMPAKWTEQLRHDCQDSVHCESTSTGKICCCN